MQCGAVTATATAAAPPATTTTLYLSIHLSIYPPIRLFVYGEEQVAGLIEA